MLLMKVPSVLCEAILRLEGHKQEGIFRLSADNDELCRLKMALDAADSTDPPLALFAEVDVHVLAALLKQWFRELPDPLIPTHHYDEAMGAAARGDAAHCCRLVDKLPALHRLATGHLVRFLQVVAADENVALSRMDDANLALVWAPNILRAPRNRDVLEGQSPNFYSCQK